MSICYIETASLLICLLFSLKNILADFGGCFYLFFAVELRLKGYDEKIRERLRQEEYSKLVH